MTVELFKKTNTYTDATSGEEKKATRFFVKCNEDLIPIEVTYFGTSEKPDTQYRSRKSVLSAFASILPEKEGAK